MTEQYHGDPQDNTLEALVRRLTALVVKIDERDDHLMELTREQRATTTELKEFNRQQLDINKDVTTTLARVETLLSRMIPQSGNGTEA